MIQWYKVSASQKNIQFLKVCNRYNYLVNSMDAMQVGGIQNPNIYNIWLDIPSKYLHRFVNVLSAVCTFTKYVWAKLEEHTSTKR